MDALTMKEYVEPDGLVSSLVTTAASSETNSFGDRDLFSESESLVSTPRELAPLPCWQAHPATGKLVMNTQSLFGQNSVKGPVVDDDIRTRVGEDTVRTWFLGGAGVYNLRITRVSACTAHCEGNVAVLRQDTGEIIWRLDQLRSDQDGVDVSFSIPIPEKCLIQVTLQAHHFGTRLVPAGRSTARVLITHTSSS